MLKKHFKYIGLSLVVALYCGYGVALAANPALTKSNPQQFLFTYKLELKNNSDFTQIFSVFMPHYESDEFQDIEYRHLPAEPTPMMNVESHYLDVVVELAPKEKKTVLYEFVATVYDITADFTKVDVIHPYDTSSEFYRRYTAPEPPIIDPSHPVVQEIYAKLLAQEPDNLVEYARLANQYVVKNYRYFSSSHFYSVDETLKKKHGNCEDLSGLLVSLLRARGIPSRVASGVNNEGRGHTRAEFFLENYGWFPVEGVSDKFFGLIDYGRFSGIFSSQKTNTFQFESDKYGLIATIPNSGRIGIYNFSGRGVVADEARYFVKLENGEPVGKTQRIWKN